MSPIINLRIFENDTFESVILESVKIKSLGVDAHCHCNIVEKTSDIVLPDNAPIFFSPQTIRTVEN